MSCDRWWITDYIHRCIHTLLRATDAFARTLCLPSFTTITDPFPLPPGYCGSRLRTTLFIRLLHSPHLTHVLHRLILISFTAVIPRLTLLPDYLRILPATVTYVYILHYRIVYPGYGFFTLSLFHTFPFVICLILQFLRCDPVT